jgi:hypothetical protein
VRHAPRRAAVVGVEGLRLVDQVCPPLDELLAVVPVERSLADVHGQPRFLSRFGEIGRVAGGTSGAAPGTGSVPSTCDTNTLAPIRPTNPSPIRRTNRSSNRLSNRLSSRLSNRRERATAK